MYFDALDVDDVIAHLLVTEGFTTIEDVAFVPVEDLAGIEGFDEEVAEELRARARAYLEQIEETQTQKRRELGVTDEVAAIEGLTTPLLVKLGEAGVKTLDDLGDLARDELLDIVGAGEMSAEEADRIILAARAHWFPDEDLTAPVAEPEETGTETDPKTGTAPRDKGDRDRSRAHECSHCRQATARDAGDRPDRLAPDEAAGLRRCLVTRARRPRSGLVRFVVGPDGRITPDVAEKLPGRGLWLSARKDIIALAVAKGVFARAARQTVTVPDGLAQDVATLLAARCRAYLGLARKAGEAVLGFEQVKAWLEQGRAALLFEAGDGAEGGKAKLRRPALAARREAPGGSLPVFQCLTAAELVQPSGVTARCMLRSARGVWPERSSSRRGGWKDFAGPTTRVRRMGPARRVTSRARTHGDREKRRQKAA